MQCFTLMPYQIIQYNKMVFKAMKPVNEKRTFEDKFMGWLNREHLQSSRHF